MMTVRWYGYRCCLLMLLVVLGGCAGGGTAIRYYLVDPVAQPARESRHALVVEIMDLHLPQYLERFNIATRDAGNQLRFSEFNQWGESLRKNLLRTLASNLSYLLDTNDVGTPLNRTLSAPDYRLQLHIGQFERDETGVVILQARWQVQVPGQSATLRTHDATLRTPVTTSEDDYSALVATMQSQFAELSARIADSILALDAGGGD